LTTRCGVVRKRSFEIDDLYGFNPRSTPTVAYPHRWFDEVTRAMTAMQGPPM
jgi:hypothetical protein